MKREASSVNKMKKNNKKNIFSVLNDPKMPLYMFYKNYNFLIENYKRLYNSKIKNKDIFWKQNLIPLNKFNWEGYKKEFDKLKDKIPENIKNNLSKYDIKNYSKIKQNIAQKNIKMKNEKDILEKEILPINNLDVKLNIKFKSEKEKCKNLNKIPNQYFLKPIKFIENDDEYLDYFELHNHLNKNLFKKKNIKLIKLFHKINNSDNNDKKPKLYDKNKIEYLLKERFNAFTDYKNKLKIINNKQNKFTRTNNNFNTKSQKFYTQTFKDKSNKKLFKKGKNTLNIIPNKKKEMIFNKSEVKNFNSFWKNWLKYIQFEDLYKDEKSKNKLEAFPKAYLKYKKIDPQKNFFCNFKKNYEVKVEKNNDFKIMTKRVKENYINYLKKFDKKE